MAHLISRFVDRNWYIGADAERACYLALLQRALRESDWRCLGYAVMSNHIHHAAIVGARPLASWIRRVHSPFADWMNRTHGRIGTIFVRGPKEIETPPERVGALIAYIHNNPVRAGIVTEPSASDWTSHRAYLGQVRAPDWLHVREGLAMAGIERPDAFDTWVRTRPNERDVVKAIKLADEPPLQHGAECAIRAEELIRLAADELGIAVGQLCSRRRTLAEVVGRRVVIHAAAKIGMCGAQVASALGVSQQTASKIGREPVERAIDELVRRLLSRTSASSGVSYPHNA